MPRARIELATLRFSGWNVRYSIRRVVSSILAPGTKIFVVPGEHSFSSFQVEIFTGSVCVLLTSVSLKLIKIRIKIFFTAAWLAQLGERRSAEREVAGSNPGRTNTQGL